MKIRSMISLCAVLGVVATILTGCSRDPEVRKRKYFESGQRYFEKGKYREAVIQFSNAIQEDPRYVDAQYQLAKSYLKLEDYKPAFDNLQRTLEIAKEDSADNYAAHLDLANLLIAANDLKQAQEHTNLLLKKQPDNPLVHEATAHLLVGQGNITAGIQEIQNAIRLAPQRWEPYLDLAQMQENANQYDLAENNFKNVLQLNPKATKARLAYAEFCGARGRLQEAEQQIRTAIDTDPTDTDARAALARLYVIEGKKDAAEAFLKQVKRDFPDNSVGYRMLGDFYFAVGDIPQATSEYSSLYHDHPQDPRVKSNYVQLLIVSNRLDEARRLDDEILKDNPNSEDALICRAQIQTRDGHPRDAVDTLQRVLANAPDLAPAHYHLGVAYDAQGNSQLAETEWQNAVRLSPDLIEAHRALAGAALKRRDAAALEQSAGQIIRLAPGSPDGYALRSACYISRGQYDRAEADVNKAIELGPKQAAGYLQLGSLRLVQGRFDQAETAFRQALDRDPGSSDSLAGLMNTYLAQKEPDKAVAVARDQIQKAPNNSIFQDLLGTVLFESFHDASAAEAALKHSLVLDPYNSDALIKLGRLEAGTGAVDEAIATYQNSLKNNPGQPDVCVLTGELYATKHDWDDAKQMYQRALDVNPRDPLASNDMAYALVQSGGNVDVALSLAQTARKGLPNSPNVADTLGWIYYQKGAYPSAIDSLQEALRLIEKNKAAPNATIHYHLGLAYEKVNQPALAREHLQRVLKINPNYSEAEEVRKQLAELHS
jgi:cellulose synthase operon protein C